MKKLINLIWGPRNKRAIVREAGGSSRDIEDKIKQIEAQGQRLAAVFNSMVEGVIATDRAGRIISVNPAFEKIFSVSKKEVEGKFLLEVIRNKDISEVIEKVLRGGQGLSGQIDLVLPVRKIFQYNGTPIFLEGAVSGCLVVLHDITETRRLETVRRDFIANVSHELKTPLTSIKGFVETLLEGAIDDRKEAVGFLKIIQDHTDRLDKLVDDLLSLAGLEEKEIELEKKNFDLRQQVDEIMLGFKSQLKKKGIDTRNELASSVNINADRHRIGQVLTNIIDNAIKFNKEKGLVKIYARDEAGNKVRVIIEDSGLGIPEKDIPRIFERFYRVDKARSRSLGGTGLGLSIVKHIVELHGGEVGVESVEGLGSKFYFTLPK